MIDLRRVRVGIALQQHIQWYEGLRVKASGTKYANPLQNECTITIDGLNATTRYQLLTETSSYRKRKQAIQLIVEVGRVNSGIFRLFVGDIVSAEPASPPDVTVTLKAKTGNHQAREIVSSSAGAVSKLSDIVPPASRVIVMCV